MIDVEVKTVGPDTVAYLPMTGAYDQIPDAMGRLYGWVAQEGLVPAGPPGAVYLTPPDADNPSDNVWELWAPVAGEVALAAPQEDGCGVKSVAQRTVATAMHIGPYEEIGTTYDELAGWIGGRGYRIVGPPEEYYLSDPADTPPEQYVTEIRFAVASA